MANKWSITPTGATIDENGNATFPKNTSPNEIVYTITYDDECSASATVIQNGAECEDFNFTSPSSSETLSFTSHSNVLIATTDKDFCDLVVSGSLPDFITSTSKTQSNTDKEYRANINANMSGSQRNGKVKFIPTDTDFDCSFSATVVQDSVTCDNYGFTAITNSIGYADGSTGHVASSNSSLAALDVNTTLPSWISNIEAIEDTNNHIWKYIATVTANTSSTPNTIDIAFKPSDSSISCTGDFKTTVIQEGRNCDAYAPTTTTTSLPASQNTNFEIATSNYALAFSSNTIDTNFITATGRTQTSGVYHYTVTTTANPNQSTRTKTIAFKHNTSGCEYPITLTQAARSCACSDFIWDSETTRTIDSEGGNTIIRYTGCTTPTVKYYNGSTEISKPDYVTTSITSTSTTLTLTSASSPRDFSIAFFVNNSKCKEYLIQQEGSSCASQWKFTTGETINSGWITEKDVDLNGMGGFGLYIWSGETKYRDSDPKNNFEIITDDVRISCNITMMQNIPDSHNNENYYIMNIDFTFACDFLSENKGFTMYIVPKVCHEVTAGKIDCAFEKTKWTFIATTTTSTGTKRNDIKIPCTYTICIDKDSDDRCNGTCEINDRTSFSIPQITDTSWSASGFTVIGELIGWNPGCGVDYSYNGTTCHYCGENEEGHEIAITNIRINYPYIRFNFDQTKPI